MTFLKLSSLVRLLGKELSRRMIGGERLYFPYLRIHIVDIETIVGQNRDLITQVDQHCFDLMTKSFLSDEASLLKK